MFLIVLTVIGTQVGRFEETTNGVPMMEVPEVVSRDLYTVASSYPEEAVRIYQQVLQPLDILLPITAGLWFAIGLAVLTTRLFPASSKWRYLPLLGVLATLTDWAENLGVFFILRTIDNPVAWLDPLTRSLVVAKFMVGAVSFLLLAGLLIVLLVRRLRQRFSDSEPE